MNGYPANEVLRTIDLTEVPDPPAVWSLAIDLERALRSESDAADDDARRVGIWFFVLPVVARRSVQNGDRGAVFDDEEQLPLFVDFGESSVSREGLSWLLYEVE